MSVCENIICSGHYSSLVDRIPDFDKAVSKWQN